MLSVGEILRADSKVRKPKTAYEHIIAEDDGLIHEGSDFTVTEVLKSDDADISDLYKTTPTGLLKIAKSTIDNDLVENETRVLTYLTGRLKANSTFASYFPRLLQVLNHDGHVALVTSYADGFVSLADILRAYPKGIDFRDMVWMYKRLLVGLGFAHEQGVLHGAVLPPHVLVHPTDHGAVIVDWSYALTDPGPKDRIKAMSLPYESFYALEIPRKETSLKPSTDIYMAATCAVALLGGDVKTGIMPDSVPKEIRDFFTPSLDESAKHRPQSAWDLHEQFDALLQKVVGKPTYRPFKMP